MNVPLKCTHCNFEIGPMYPIYIKLRPHIIAAELKKKGIEVTQYSTAPFMDIDMQPIFNALQINKICCRVIFTATDTS